METIRILLSFIVPLVFIFYMIKKKADVTLLLFLSAIISGIIAGVPLTTILSTLKTGFGSVLSQVGLLVLFGVIFSEYLEQAGGIKCLARFIAKRTTPNGSIYAIYAFGYIVSIPVNFTAATTMIVPMIKRLSKDTGKPLVAYACAFSTASFLTNCLVVPTLTPALLAGMAGIEIGPFMALGIVISLILSLICALGGALILARRRGAVEHVGSNLPEDFEDSKEQYPSVKTVAGLIFLPILLILLGTIIPKLLALGTIGYEVISFIGEPTGALFVTIIIEMLVLRNYLKDSNPMPVFAAGIKNAAGLIVLLGAANAFGEVLSAGGIGTVIMGLFSNVNVSVLLLAFLMVSILRAGTGAMTVAATTALPLLLPVLEQNGGSPTLLVIACCLGCCALIIPSCTEFWIFKDAYGISVRDTFMSITIPSTVSAVLGIMILLIIEVFMPGLSF